MKNLNIYGPKLNPKFVPRRNEVVIGLFGDVKKQDFGVLSRILKPSTHCCSRAENIFSDMVEDVTFTDSPLTL